MRARDPGADDEIATPEPRKIAAESFLPVTCCTTFHARRFLAASLTHGNAPLQPLHVLRQFTHSTVLFCLPAEAGTTLRKAKDRLPERLASGSASRSAVWLPDV